MADNDNLKVRIAWAYYFEGLTQNQIADRFGINRVRVTRLLAACRDEGIVEIRINSPDTDLMRLESELTQRWGLRRAIVAPKAIGDADVRDTVASAAGRFLSDLDCENKSIGIGWGKTLSLSLRRTSRRSVHNLSVVALMGALTASSRLNTYECASHLAHILDATCYYCAAPAFCPDEASKEVLMSQNIVREVLERATQVDIAVLSVGSFDSASTLVSQGLVSDEESNSLAAANAVGDILGHFVDSTGNVIDHPLNKRVVALDPARLRDIAEVVLVSGGEQKVPAIRASLTGRYVSTLITDEATAQALLSA